MVVIEPGHIIRLDQYDGEDTEQLLVFMKRVGKGYPGNEGSPHPGTNCQEVLRGLFHRARYLNNVNIPHPRNSAIAQHLSSALLEFELRAAERHGYGSEASCQLHNMYADGMLMTAPTCRKCGHIICHDEGHR